MPRRRQYQPPQAANAQAYGLRGDQMAAQSAMPLPQTNQSQPTPPSPTATQDLIAQAAQFDPGITPLFAPSQNPAEPVTAGLPIGPGPGVEALSVKPDERQQTIEMLLAMAADTGNNSLAHIAMKIKNQTGMF